MIIGVCLSTALKLSRMQDQKSLMIRRCSFSGGDSDVVAGLCAHKDGKYWDYSSIVSHSPVIIQDATPEIGDAPLTLISRIGQQEYFFPFSI